MSENNSPEFDTNQVTELIEKHRAAETRRKQREIENEVLEETVWSEGDPVTTGRDTYSLSPEELRTVYQALLDADANEGVQKMLHNKLVDGL